MISIDKHDVYKIVITLLLGVLAMIGRGILNNQRDISRRLRAVELNQAAIMQQIGVDPIAEVSRPVGSLPQTGRLDSFSDNQTIQNGLYAPENCRNPPLSE